MTHWMLDTIPSSEEMVFAHFTDEQIKELEQLWCETPDGKRLEVLAARAAELGVEVVAMRRRRS